MNLSLSRGAAAVGDVARGDRDGLPQLLQLLLFFGEPLLPPRALGLLVAEVAGVAAAVADRTAGLAVGRGRVEVDDVGADGVEEHPVVRRQHHDPGQLGEVAFQERHRGVVEVVGRLVEQQRLRLPDQQRRQAEPRPLPAGQRAEPPVRFDAAEAEPVTDELRAPVGVPEVVGLGPFQDAAVLVQHRRVVRPVGHRRGQLVEPGGGDAALGQRVVEDVAEGRVHAERQLLQQEPDVRAAQHLAGAGFFEPGEQPQQRGLAGAVLADQAEPLPGRRGQRDAVEDDAGAVAEDDVLGLQGKEGGHVRSPGPDGKKRKSRRASWHAGASGSTGCRLGSGMGAVQFLIVEPG